ncbi:MAG: hypothetical protein OXH92_16230 [Bryobacterales bacterium]|nr:hypothetical protein [Bryobacterales bacterium]
MKRRRRRRKPASKHISISATDADWEVVRSHADRRGLSIARYLVELVERDGSDEDTGLRHECPGLALSAEEQREQLESVREVRALMLEGEDAGPRHECLGHECLVRDMQERIAVIFTAWASAMAASGRTEELHAALTQVLGEERARIAATSIAASVVAPAGVSTPVSTDAPAAKQVESHTDEGKTDPRRDRLL